MYADCFLIPIKRKMLPHYRKVASLGRKIWLKHGALDYKETYGDDLKAMKGFPSFTKLAKLKPGETVIIAWITYKSKAHRDKVNKKVMTDPRMAKKPDPMPFDEKKMHYGGFKVLVGA